jgi:hypothetical protein
MIPSEIKSTNRAPASYKVNPALTSEWLSVPSPKNALIALKRIITTPSLTTPSPKTTLKSLGVSIGSKSETAATVSVEHKREPISKISCMLRFRADSRPVDPSI